MRFRTLFLTALSVLLLAASCGATVQERSADDFNGLIQRDLSVDYEPLASPSQALATADLVVRGTVVGAEEGMVVTAPHDPTVIELTAEEEALPEPDRPDLSDIPDELVLASFVTLLLEVEQVISGDGANVGDLLPIQIDHAPATNVKDLVGVAPLGPAVFILEDATDWIPSPDAVFNKPPRLETEEFIFIPYTDGIWLTTSDGLGGPFASKEELSTEWARPQSVEDIAVVLVAASGP